MLMNLILKMDSNESTLDYKLYIQNHEKHNVLS